MSRVRRQEGWPGGGCSLKGKMGALIAGWQGGEGSEPSVRTAEGPASIQAEGVAGRGPRVGPPSVVEGQQEAAETDGRSRRQGLRGWQVPMEQGSWVSIDRPGRAVVRRSSLRHGGHGAGVVRKSGRLDARFGCGLGPSVTEWCWGRWEPTDGGKVSFKSGVCRLSNWEDGIALK